MSEPELRISDDVAFPLDAVTQTFLILGKRGSGKTNTGGVFTEAMIRAGLPVAVIDPLGVWWGLRSSADGTGPGLPVTIIGGEHGDLPLPADGALVAALLVEERLPVVIDLSELSKTKQRQWVCAFLEYLYRHNREPLHVVVDEADIFAPMRATAEIARLLGAYEDMVRRGRARGIGCTSITQRVSGMHTDIRSQAEALIAHRLIGTHDVVALDDWIRLHADPHEATEMKASLPSLPVGTAWVWSPGWLELLVRTAVWARSTFDSSATPKVGQKRIVPRDFARVDPADLERLAGRLGQGATEDAAPAAGNASTAEVKRLRAEIARLQRALADAVRRPAERVEVPILPPGDIAALDQSVTAMKETAERIELALRTAQRATATSPPSARPVPASRPAPAAPAAPKAPTVASEDEGEFRLAKAEKAILAVLAQFPDGRTKRQIGMLTGYSSKSGGFNGALARLRGAGMVERGDPVVITVPGLAALGDDWEPLPSGPALIDYWTAQLSKAEGGILRVLLDAYPDAVPKAEIAARLEYSANSGGFNGALARLRGLLLVEDSREGLRADETLAQHAQGGIHA